MAESEPSQQPPYPQQQQWQQPYPPQPQQILYPPQQIIINNTMQNVGRQQISTLVRVLYFLCIGWWLSLMWLSIAIVLICTFIGAPVGFVMLGMLPVVLTLHRN